MAGAGTDGTHLLARHKRSLRAVGRLDMSYHGLECRDCTLRRCCEKRLQAGPAALSSCARCSLVLTVNTISRHCLLFHVLLSSARARTRSSFVLIALIWSMVYGGGPGGAILRYCHCGCLWISRLLHRGLVLQAQVFVAAGHAGDREMLWGDPVVVQACLRDCLSLFSM